ncbi:pilus assembly protein N-terminal domain-containing protein [Bradyrhizobium genosp. P]|uniref:pilus assembly protein N-terminal domain-containing protein n=1 Tax=Bradyrhizobium genosp. P TaxID=83641 RepID=UPI003CFB31C8
MRSLLMSCAISATIMVGQAQAQTQPQAQAEPQTQAPREVIAVDTIELRAEQTRTFAFDEPVTKFNLSAEGVAQIIPETDRTFTVRAVAPGKVLMTAYAPDGRVVHRSNILVAPSEGFVKIYGHRETKDFAGFYCSNSGCGRADPDKVPYTASVQQAQQKSRGDSDNTMKEEVR